MYMKNGLAYHVCKIAKELEHCFCGGDACCYCGTKEGACRVVAPEQVFAPNDYKYVQNYYKPNKVPMDHIIFNYDRLKKPAAAPAADVWYVIPDVVGVPSVDDQIEDDGSWEV